MPQVCPRPVLIRFLDSLHSILRAFLIEEQKIVKKVAVAKAQQKKEEAKKAAKKTTKKSAKKTGKK